MASRSTTATSSISAISRSLRTCWPSEAAARRICRGIPGARPSSSGRGDRLGRSLQDLIGTLNELRAKEVDLYLHKQSLVTSTPTGKAMFQMLGVFAKFEREIIAERIYAGLARAREQRTKSGNPIGRPEKFGRVRRKAISLNEEGLGTRRIAERLGVSRSTVIKALREDEAA